MLTQEDYSDLQKNKKDLEIIQRQFACIMHDSPCFSIYKPATLGDGIYYFPKEEQEYFRQLFDESFTGITATKFIPASGIASRMFSVLRDFLHSFNPQHDDLDLFLEDENNKEFRHFVNQIERFSFYDLIQSKIEKKGNTHKNKAQFIIEFIQILLDDPEVGMEGKAKAILPLFSDSKGGVISAFELQIIEALKLFPNRSKTKVHFTIDADQFNSFQKLEHSLFERLSTVDQERLQVEYSFQDSNTDSIALLYNDHYLRDENEKLVFRKSGHGALFQNIKRFRDDFIFIKSIDSIWPEDQQSIAIQKSIAGLYWERFNQIKDLLDLLKDHYETAIPDALTFIKIHFHIDLRESFLEIDFEEQTKQLIDFLNRPFRVCGMVKNEGKPGGGPFWIEREEKISLQIVESSELESSQGALNDAIFFNPVNMVCGMKNFEGKPWDLDQFKDFMRVIISKKTQFEMDIRTFEYPGLWNGSMGYWNSIFVEIPTQTFRSLKTINDCLDQKKE